VKKDELIAQLLLVPGNPEVLAWDPEEWDYWPVYDMTLEGEELKLLTDSTEPY
jgi:hypothetical protein